MVTACTKPATASIALDGGADDFQTKPVMTWKFWRARKRCFVSNRQRDAL
jgi:hypothetical protein